MYKIINWSRVVENDQSIINVCLFLILVHNIKHDDDHVTVFYL